MRGLQGPRGTVVIKGGLGGDAAILCPYCGDRTVTRQCPEMHRAEIHKDSGMMVSRGWGAGGRQRESLCNGEGISVWEDEESSGDGWW